MARRTDIVGCFFDSPHGATFVEDLPERLLGRYQPPESEDVSVSRCFFPVPKDADDDGFVEVDPTERKLDDSTSGPGRYIEVG